MNNIADEDYDFLYKIVLAGQTNVGKTHIVQRYIKNSLPRNPAPTIGVEFATRLINLKTGGTAKAQIWDTAGQERYHAIVSAHYRRAIGALLVYDITQESSFANLRRWIDELKSKADPDIVIVLVGNKVDLVKKNPNARRVSIQAAETLAKREGLFFIETSAIAGDRIKQAFEELIDRIAESQKNKGRTSITAGEQLAVNPVRARKSTCC